MGKFLNKKILSQSKFWGILARIAPMIALGAIAIAHFFNYTDWVYIAIATMFFSSCVYWWFWSTWSIYKMSKLLKEAETKLKIVTASIKEIKKDVDKLE